ncbi:MAG: hypothetical protein EA401_03750 [Planctomycetota bacterium]|nr:MAG: hypothetical protein EA401_03750 [Planctomycetota bacterium]
MSNLRILGCPVLSLLAIGLLLMACRASPADVHPHNGHTQVTAAPTDNGPASPEPEHDEDQAEHDHEASDDDGQHADDDNQAGNEEQVVAPPQQGELGDLGKVALIEVFGMIDPRQLRYVERVIGEAKAAGVDTIVTRIESPGGFLGTAIDLLELVIDASRDDGPRMIAWIDRNAYSAAAMLAYGHEAIYMQPGSIIGNIGIIFQGPDGTMEYGPEKIETSVRTILRSTAEARGWNKALLVKMTARNQELFQARFADGRREYVIEDDVGTFLADHPEIDPEDSSQWVLISGEDRLLTFTADEAYERNMATGLADNIDDLWKQLGVDPDEVLNLSPTQVELTARRLGMLAPIFISLAIIFLLFEFKTPGVGIFALLSGVCATIFFLMQYYQDLISNWEFVFMGLGLILVLIELFTLIGAGILGIVGGLLIFAGVLGAFLPSDFSWDFQDTGSMEALYHALINLGIVIGICLIGLVAFITLAPRLPLLDRISNIAVLKGNSSGSIEAAQAQRSSQADQTPQYATVVSECRPAGTIQLNDEVVSARSEHSAFIAEGTRVEIVRAEFGELVVRPVEDSQSHESPEGAPA